VKKEMANELKENGVTIQSDELPSLSIVRVQFHQLFQNLIGNSIKYRKKEVPLKIVVSAEKVKGKIIGRPEAVSDKDYWKLSFQDNGIGFEPQYSEKIFEVFQRLHSKDKYEGTGIGLAICKKVALTHRGFITASGVPDEGALFVIYIPVDDESNS
jgi:light-regulated signal transduction histidine kinase (bacteriophytochrome)